MRFLLIMISFFYASCLFAQKPIIDSVAYKEWPSLGSPSLSIDGKYVMYNVNNIPVGSKTFIVQSTDGKWKKEFKGGLQEGYISFKGKYLWFLRNDSLGMLLLGSEKIKYIPKVTSFWFQKAENDEYLVYRMENSEKALVVKSLRKHNEIRFTDVVQWKRDGDWLVFIKSIQPNNKQQSIHLLDLKTGMVYKIWKGDRPENLVLDIKHKQLAFKTADSVWYYREGNSEALCIVKRDLTKVENDLLLGELESFIGDGKFILTSLNSKRNETSTNKGVKIWSYTDIRLSTEQEVVDEKYLAVISITDRKITQLQQEAGESFYFPKSEGSQDSLALVEKQSAPFESWSIGYKSIWSLINLKNGKRRNLRFLDNIGASFSPSGKYLIYFDDLNADCFSYEIAIGKIRNLTKGISTSWIDINSDDRQGVLGRPGGHRGVATWLKHDQYLLIYDRYDIWKLDPLNEVKPINLTHNYGSKHETIFNVAFSQTESSIMDTNSRVYLIAFNKQNKNNGFFRKQLNKIGDPELLAMGPYIYSTNSGNYVPYGIDFSPIKAENAEMYLVRRMSATEAPNYFSTKDFKNFTRLSDLKPQKKYNWYKTELHNWKSLNGSKLQGILYKPSNFDPNKKYPVIFHFYERKSDGLNAYLQPETLCNGCNIDIPTYVSNGYLVFTPDIYYKIGDPMQGTYDAVISAANYVTTLPFVNSKRMGLQGCSFGGIQINYIITQSNLFAAAQSSSGIADWISGYGSVNLSGSLQSCYYERGQARMGVSLWENPQPYIKNSPIFQINKITTPLLIMHTVNDGICPYSNAIEFFTGLRRTGKKAWMLAYPDENHALTLKNHADDFGARMMQFFDHYLKDKPVPIWMLDEIPASKRGLQSALQLDNAGRTPGPGILTFEEQKKIDSINNISPKTIVIK